MRAFNYFYEIIKIVVRLVSIDKKELINIYLDIIFKVIFFKLPTIIKKVSNSSYFTNQSSSAKIIIRFLSFLSIWRLWRTGRKLMFQMQVDTKVMLQCNHTPSLIFRMCQDALGRTTRSSGRLSTPSKNSPGVPPLLVLDLGHKIFHIVLLKSLLLFI